MEERKALIKQCAAAVSIASTCLSIGMVLGYSSVAIPSLQNGHSTLNITDNDATWIGSLVPIGAVVGTVTCGPFLSWMGRRHFMLLLLAPLALTGWVLTATAVHVGMIYAGRLLGGIHTGMATVAGPVYVVELVDVQHRGIFGSLPMISIVCGVLVVSLFGMFMNWIWMAICGSISVIPSILLIYFCAPESPQWLVSKARSEEACKILNMLRGSPELAKEQLVSIQVEEENRDNSIGFKDVFQDPSVLKAFGVAVGIAILHQLTGASALLLYTVSILEATSSSMNPNLIAVVIAAVNLLASILLVCSIERLGRRPLMLLSFVLCGLADVALGAYFYLNVLGLTANIEWLPAVSVMIFLVAYSFGIGPLVFLLLAELLPRSFRVILMPVAVCINSVTSFVIAKTFIDLEYYLYAYGTFWLYGVMCFAGTLFVLCFVPETKGKSEEEIRNHFASVK